MRRKRKTVTRGKMIRARVRCRSDLVGPRTSRGVALVLALLAVALAPLVRVVVVGSLVVLEARNRVMVVEVGPQFAAGVIIDILVSVGEAAVVALLVGRWDIGLQIVPRVSRSLSRLSCHHLYRFSKFLVLVVMCRQVEVVPITIRAMLFLMPRDNNNIPRTHILRMVIPSILVAICCILQFQQAGLSGFREDRFSRGRMLRVVQGLRGSLVSPVRGVALRVVVARRAEVEVDDSRPRGVFIIFLCMTLRTIPI